LALATLPQGLGLLWFAAEYAGLLAPVWERRYLMSASMLLSVPVLALALSQITRDRKDRLQRAKLLSTQDALTGLLNQQAFELLLETALNRVRSERETVVLALVRVTNLPAVLASYDNAVAEQCELQAVVRLHRVLRDVDPACRLGPGTFALLLEGVRSRAQVNARMTELLASGLKPQAGMVHSIALEFHAACVLLHENPLEHASAIPAVSELLNRMRPGTRRPIRFLEAAMTQPVGLQA
jgi:GGDEF domain-containing protein